MEEEGEGEGVMMESEGVRGGTECRETTREGKVAYKFIERNVDQEFTGEDNTPRGGGGGRKEGEKTGRRSSSTPKQPPSARTEEEIQWGIRRKKKRKTRGVTSAPKIVSSLPVFCVTWERCENSV